MSLAEVTVVDQENLPQGCQDLGKFEGTPGYGKQLDGKRIALFRAKKKAEDAGANYAVVIELNGGPSGLSGYCQLVGYRCPEGE